MLRQTRQSSLFKVQQCLVTAGSKKGETMKTFLLNVLVSFLFSTTRRDPCSEPVLCLVGQEEGGQGGGETAENGGGAVAGGGGGGGGRHVVRVVAPVRTAKTDLRVRDCHVVVLEDKLYCISININNLLVHFVVQMHTLWFGRVLWSMLKQESVWSAHRGASFPM